MRCAVLAQRGDARRERWLWSQDALHNVNLCARFGGDSGAPGRLWRLSIRLGDGGGDADSLGGCGLRRRHLQSEEWLHLSLWRPFGGRHGLLATAEARDAHS
jgi:hypothetical protein